MTLTTDALATTPHPAVLVTGATSGIGRDAALAFARRGFQVFATGRNQAALDALAATAEAESLALLALRLDVTDADSIAAAAEHVRAETGGRGVDVLVNNAGYGLVAPIAEVSDADLRRQFDTNVFGLVAVTRAFVGDMIERGAGRIINVSSVGGTITMPMMGAYSATKYAVESISDALRLELRPFGVEVSIIEPGPVRTDFEARAIATAGGYRDPSSPYAPVLARTDALAKDLDRAAIEVGAVTRAILRAATARRAPVRIVTPRYLGWVLGAARLMPTPFTDFLFRAFAGLSRRRLRPEAAATA